MIKIYCLLIGYLAGCFQTAYIVGRIFNVDIKRFGSRNAGATNISRALGKFAGISVALIDILKSIAIYFLCIFLFKEKIFGLYAGLGVVLGHNFTFYLKFNGGKGVASTGGLLMAFDWRVGLLIFLIWLASVLLIRKIFFGAIISAVVLPFILFFYRFEIEPIIILSLLSLIVLLKHISNFKKIICDKENTS
ncbi:MAG: glycerol-3-phosphate 1-O-acyltransferase PlsY [Clostridiales bacterium]|jgi:glycerol-3-phosphate acyltransferase PlsY|nr:glycerol-3-phosphate 1-O-acyltransferase PlsY [Clostridiales bacterium]